METPQPVPEQEVTMPEGEPEVTDELAG